MLDKKFMISIFSLFFILPKYLLATNFLIVVINESDDEYACLEITIQPVGFRANDGHILIKNIMPCIMSYPIEESEFNTPLLSSANDEFFNKRRIVNLNIDMHLVPKTDNIAPKSFGFKPALSLPAPLTFIGDNRSLVGVQVPNMTITINKEGDINATFDHHSIDDAED